MNIDVKIDTTKLKTRTLRERKRLAYSTVQALNKTATQIQTAERVNLDRKFTIRKAGFIYRLIKVNFASVAKARPVAEIYVDNTKQRVLLPLFEEGGEKQPSQGKNIAVPLTGEAARPSFGQLVQNAFMFGALKFKRRDPVAGTTPVFEGQQRTFLIPGVGVFMRVARKVTNLIYAFKRPMHLDKRLGFTEVAQKTFNERFNDEFMKAYNSKKGE